MSTISIEKARELKCELQADIKRKLQEFMDETGLPVKGVRVFMASTEQEPIISCTIIDVEF